GKSTVARRLSERLGFRYLDTGAMYRALTWLAMQRGVPLDKGEALAELAADNPVTFDERGRVFLAGTDVTASIRESRIDRLVPVAETIDTTELHVDDVVGRIAELVRARQPA